MVLAAALSVQFGAALGTTLFDTLGPGGASLLRQLFTAVILLALWRPRRARVRVPRWRGPRTALAGVYVRGLARRAGDALVRGLGLAVLGGIAGALIVRNNHLDGLQAAVLASAVIAIVKL